MTLQEKASPIILAIGEHLIEATPEWWTCGTLTVEQITDESGYDKMRHTITNQEGRREPVMPTDEIMAATFQLAEVFREYGKPWKKIISTINQLPSGEWDSRIKFEY